MIEKNLQDERKLTILLDIDGVVASYPFAKGDTYDETKMGEPLPGAVKAVQRLHAHYKLVIFTTRKEEVVKPWLEKHNIPFDDYFHKPLNWVIIDDRAIQFNGDWNDILKQIGQFQPWHKRNSIKE